MIKCACTGYWDDINKQYYHNDSCFDKSSRAGEMADTGDLKSPEETHSGSSPEPGTILNKYYEEREVLKKYLKVKFEAEDWHGVQDAASDLRDVDNFILGFNWPK